MRIRNIGILAKNSIVLTKLYLPDREPKKLVVFCHGFPGSNRLPGLAPSLITHEIGLVEVGYRGDKGSEGKFSFIGSSFDIWQTYKWLDFAFSSIPKILLGYSAGGFYAQLFLIRWEHYPERLVLLNSVVDTFAFNHLEELWQDAEKILSLYEKNFYENEINSIVGSQALISLMDEINVPTTMLHSENDEIIPYSRAEKFFTEHDFVENLVPIPNKGHILDGSEPELLNSLLA